MKKKILIITSIIFLLIAVAGYLYIQKIKSSALADYNQTISLKGLQEEVIVYRDSNGIPHIVAKNQHDLYMAVGYISAQDRLWQLDLLRRVTQGRLSEIFGEELVETDVLLRKLRMSKTSEKLYQKLNDDVKKPLEYFAKGINQYIENQKEELPFEFKILGYQPEKWKPQESLNLVGYMAWTLELGYKMEVVLNQIKNTVSEQHFKELLPNYKQMKTTIYPSFELTENIKTDSLLVASLEQIGQLVPDIFNGSNNWVVSGKKSTTGKPIFSNDMHLGLNIPGIWTRMHFIIPGELNVTGVVLPGEPFIVAGHNEYIAWGMTNVMLDGADFYVETLHPENKKQYKFNGEWKNLEIVKEKIYVKNKKNPIEKTLYFTHRGPILTKFDEIEVQQVSMRWIGNEESYEINALYKLSTAKNWKDFKQAIQGFKSVSQNIAYADIEGNIGLHMTGLLPKRTAPGYLFYPGNTDTFDWKGFIPFDSLAFEYNPDRGFVSSANNKTVPDNYPYYISEWYDVPYRIDRIRQMLTEKKKLSTDDFKQMLNDHYSLEADLIKPILLKHLQKETNWNEQEKEIISLLAQWDNHFDIQAAAPLFFEQFKINLIKNLTADEMDSTLFKAYNRSLLFSKYLIYNVFKNDSSVWSDNVNTPEKENFKQIISLSFKETVSQLVEQYGPPKQWKWGKVHQLVLKHPIGKNELIDNIFNLNRKFSAPGNNNTVNPFTYSQENPYEVDFGASEKHIYNTANWDESYSILPTGISGNPSSKFYCNQTADFVQGKLYNDYFSLPKVIESAQYKSVFVPQR